MTNNMLDVEQSSIHLVPSFHYDVIYLKSYDEYLGISLKIIDKALDILEANPDYVFTMEQVILLEEFWERRPEKRNIVKKFVGEGRFDIAPAMYVMPDMNLIDGESMFMQAKVGKDWIKEHLGIEQDSCWIADCWGHHSQLPQILSQSGYKYYFFWRCMRRDVMKNEFIWKGLNGTTINTHWLATGYANLHFPDQSKRENALELDFAGVTPKDINSLYDTIMQYGPSDSVLMCNGGDFSSPQPSAAQIVKQLNATREAPKIQFSTPTKFMESINWGNCETVVGEFNSAFQGTFTSNIRIKQYNQHLCNKLYALEKMAVLYKKKIDLQAIWKLVLKQQFHDTICGTIADVGLKETYDDFKLIEKMIDKELEQFNNSNEPKAFFNPLSFERTEIISSEDKLYKATIPALQKKSIHEMEDVTGSPQKINLPCSFIHNYYSAKINEEGYITSLVENHSKQEIVSSGTCFFGSLSMQMDYGDLWLNFEGPLNGGSVEAALTQNNSDPLDRHTPNDIVYKNTLYPQIKRAEIIQNGEGLTIKQFGVINYWQIQVEFETEIKLSSISPVIKYRTRFIPKGKNYRIRVAFPTLIDSGKIIHEIPFGIQEREGYEHPAQSWINYSKSDIGAALFNRGIPANNVDDGIMMLTLFRSVAMEYKTDSIDSYSEGVPHEFDYAFMPHSNIEASQIINEARSFSNPLIPVDDNSLINKFKLTGSKNVHVSAIRWSDEDIFVRIYEATGETSAVSLEMPDASSQLFKADGLEKKISEPMEMTLDRTVELEFRPFEVKAFLVKI